MKERKEKSQVGTLSKLEGETGVYEETGVREKRTLRPRNHYTLRSRIGYSDNGKLGSL